MRTRRLTSLAAILSAASVLGIGARLAAQTPESAPASMPASAPTAAPVKENVMRLSVRDAVRIGAAQNTDLRQAFITQLIARTNITSQTSRFDPVVYSGLDVGNRESNAVSLFPTGTNAQGQTTYAQQVINDRSTVLSANAGLKGLLPTGTTYNLMMNTDFSDRENGGTLDPAVSTTTSLTITQPLLRLAWLQYTEAPILMARNSEKASRQRYRFDVIAKAFDIEQAYWELVFSIRNLDVKKQSLGLANRLLEINRVKVRTGVFAPIEVVAAEAGIAQRTTDVIVAENDILARADVLKRQILAFESPNEWNFAIEPLDAPEGSELNIPILDECVNISLDQRPDLAEARINLRNNAIDVAMADNETLPKFDLTGGVSYSGLSTNVERSYTQSFGDRGAESWNVGFSFEIPIGNDQARSRLARARLERDQAILGYRNLQLNATEAVRRAHRNVLIAAKTIVSSDKARELKAEEVRNEQVKFENGRSTNFQVLQVQDELAQQQITLLRARVDYRLALAELAFAMGTTTETLGWAPIAR